MSAEPRPTGAARAAVFGLGSNLGERLAAIHRAVEALRASVSVVATSAVYESAAVGPPQPAYLNAAVLATTTLNARDLLGIALGIERRMGRVRRERWGPRTIDIDLLWIDGETIVEEGLIVPHPELTRRPFALVPLLELVPGAVDPRTGAPFPPLDAGGLACAAASA